MAGVLHDQGIGRSAPDATKLNGTLGSRQFRLKERFLRVLFLERSLGRGGAQRQLVALAVGLMRRGHHVTVALFYDEGPLIGDLLEGGVQLRILGKRSRWDVLGFLRSTLRLLSVENPDVVCTFLQVPNLIAATCKLFRPKLRLVWGVRASNMDLRRYDRLTRLSYQLEILGSRLANVVISNSKTGRGFVLSKGFQADKVVVVANGIDTERFQSDPCGRRRLREEWKIADHETLVGLIGRLDPMKDHRTFIRAAASVCRQMPDLRFVCVGDEGPITFEELANEASFAGPGDRMIWSAGRDDMTAVFSACDLVCSSSAYGEGFSNTLAEAMACGRRCIATDVGDARDILGATGEIVPPANENALAESIAKLCREVKRDGETSIAAREQIVRNFSVDRMVSGFEDQFKRLIA
jgi:glycosyltransferase involved in cell wall biosynthesis